MPRLTWYSNAPWVPTGYGTQTASVIRRIKASGIDVAVLSNYGSHSQVTDWEGIPVFPPGLDAYSNDIAPAHHVAWAGHEYVPMVTLYDTWTLIPTQFERLPRVVSWTPVDHYPVPPALVNWSVQFPTIAMSQFGQRAFKHVGVDATYIPHGVETSIYQPVDGKPFRDKHGLPEDAFVIGIVAANQGNHPPRKGWGEMLQAVAAVMADDPNVYLYLHTHPTGTKGINLPALLEAVSIKPDRVKWVGLYDLVSGSVTQKDMATIYSGLDVLLMTSYGEGFGLPAIEAQACGTPVIVSDWTAQPELVGAGWTVPVQPLWDDPHRAFFGVPMVPRIVEAIETAMSLRGSPEWQRWSGTARTFALDFDHDKVFKERWQPYLSDLLRAPSRQQRRRLEKKAKR